MSEELVMFEDGYVVIRGALNKQNLQMLKAEACDIFVTQLQRHKLHIGTFEENMVKLAAQFPLTLYSCGKQVQNLWRLHQLMVSDEILVQLKQIAKLRESQINTKPVLFFHNKNLASREVYYKVPAHQDYASTQGSLNSVVVWAPLAPISEDMGRLEVLPGSHLTGAQWTDIHDNFGMCPQDGDFVPLDLEVGDMVLFSTLLVHRSGNNTTDSRIRWSVNFRYSDLADQYWIDNDYFCPYSYKSTGAGSLRPSAQEVSACLIP